MNIQVGIGYTGLTKNRVITIGRIDGLTTKRRAETRVMT